MKTLFFGFIAVAVVLFLFTRIVEPPNQLDYLDRVWPGQSNAEKLASDITFDEASAQKLNIWGSPAPAVHHKKPVLVFFYGGGWANGDRDHYGFAARAYANRGFVVVLPDYRKVPDVHFPAFNQDAAAAECVFPINNAEVGFAKAARRSRPEAAEPAAFQWDRAPRRAALRLQR